MTLEALERLCRAALTSEDPDVLAFCQPWYSPYYQLEFLLAWTNAGCTCIELGVDQGRGSFAFLHGGAGKVYAIENNVEKKCERIAGHPNFQLIHASSTPNPIPNLGTRSVDVLMIDTEHSFAQAKSEFETYKPFLKDGAVVLFDDLNAMEGEVKRYFESLPYEKVDMEALHPTCGFGALIFKEEK